MIDTDDSVRGRGYARKATDRVGDPRLLARAGFDSRALVSGPCALRAGGCAQLPDGSQALVAAAPCLRRRYPRRTRPDLT